MEKYSEDFKRLAVKKVLEPGISQKCLAFKPGISLATMKRWKKRYRGEFEPVVEDKFLANIKPCFEDSIDLSTFDSDLEDSEEEIIHKIVEKRKSPEDYTENEKYAVLNKIRSLRSEKRGIFFRRLGLHTDHIKLWEEELLDMAKKEIDKSDYIKQLEKENKRLQKQLKESDKEKKELKILISLKKNIRIFSIRTWSSNFTGGKEKPFRFNSGCCIKGVS